MALTDQTLSLIAFKNLQGKSHTDNNKGLGNEAEGIFLNVAANSIFMDTIDSDPVTAISEGVVELVSNADLTLDPTSNGHSYFASYPTGHPLSGQRITNAISPAYGFQYEVTVRDTGSNVIPVNDPRDWVYQYNSGVFYQQDVVGNNPQTIDVYTYVGVTLDEFNGTNGLLEVSNGITYLSEGTIGLGGTLTEDFTIIDTSDKTLLISNGNPSIGEASYGLGVDVTGDFRVGMGYFDPISSNFSGSILRGGTNISDYTETTFEMYHGDGILGSNSASIGVGTENGHKKFVIASFNNFGEGLLIESSTSGILLTDDVYEIGTSYNDDYSLNNINNPRWIPDKEYVDSQITSNKSIISPDDKDISGLVTVIDGDPATAFGITNTPVDGSYVAVFVNGQEFDCGNGVKTNSCYFSGDGGVNARGFLSTHPNGQVQAGDILYWNGSLAGTQIDSTWRISYIYLS